MTLLNNSCLYQDVSYVNQWNHSWNADILYGTYMHGASDECKQLHRLHYKMVIEPIMEFEWAVVNILQHFNYTFWVWSGQALDVARQTPIHLWEKGNYFLCDAAVF